MLTSCSPKFPTYQEFQVLLYSGQLSLPRRERLRSDSQVEHLNGTRKIHPPSKSAGTNYS